ncbi:MAG: hypothetical protein WKF87_22475 [Chryseolinea sp.]
MKKITVFLLIAFVGNTAFSQDCNPYFAIKEGLKVTYEFYNGKQKVVSKTTSYFKNVSGTGNNVSGTLVMEMIDPKKDDLLNTAEAIWRCENGIVYFAMNVMNMEGVDMTNAGIEVTVDGDEMDIPAAMEPGQTLKDVNYHVIIKMAGISLMNRDFHVKDRKVEEKENVTTPAGTFESVKVSYTTESVGKNGGGAKAQRTSVWYAQNVGVVKMENYKDEKVYSAQLLTKLEK